MVSKERCDATAASCCCRKKSGHKKAVHTCECGGRWTGSGDDFVPVTLPRLALDFVAALGNSRPTITIRGVDMDGNSVVEEIPFGGISERWYCRIDSLGTEGRRTDA